MNKKIIFLVALLMAFVVNGAMAADGDQLTTTDFRVNNSGQIIYKANYEVLTTNDTVTAAETGKVFLTNYNSANGPINITLPTAAAGLTYTFKNVAGHTTSNWGYMYLIPQSTDIFDGCVSSSVTSTFAAGDRLYSPGATGDSVTLVGASTKWYCIDREGTWVDGN